MDIEVDESQNRLNISIAMKRPKNNPMGKFDFHAAWFSVSQSSQEIFETNDISLKSPNIELF